MGAVKRTRTTRHQSDALSATGAVPRRTRTTQHGEAPRRTRTTRHPTPESLREATPLTSPPSLSLDPPSPVRRDSLLSPPTLNLTPVLKVLEEQEQEENNVDELEETMSEIEEKESVEKSNNLAEVVEEAKVMDGIESRNKEEISKKLMVEALEDFAEGTISCFSKQSEKGCKLCEEGIEDFKYGPVLKYDRVAALEEIDVKLFEWKRPDEAMMQRRHVEGYDSLAKERGLAMKNHGLDAKHK